MSQPDKAPCDLEYPGRLLGEPMGQRAAKDEAAGHERGVKLDVGKDVEVKATLDSCVWREDDTAAGHRVAGADSV